MKEKVYKQAIKTTSCFMITYYHARTVLSKSIEFINKGTCFYRLIVRAIQRVWRSQLFLDKLRMKILQKIWDNKVKELSNMNNKNTKKHKATLKKLREISKEDCNKAIYNYYKEIKVQYINSILKDLKTVLLKY